jgi:two-component system cell cycle sensor histidine kinase/response regulator CckA
MPAMEHSPFLLVLSMVAQLFAAAIALATAKNEKRNAGWMLLSLTFVLMAGRRAITLAGHLSPGIGAAPEPHGVEDLVALVSSLSLVAGVALMRTSFRDWRQTAERAKLLTRTAEESWQQLRERNRFLDDALSSLMHPFIVIDASNYMVKLANPASRLGAFADHGTCYALLHGRDVPCDIAEEACPLALVKRTKKAVTVEHIHTLPDGTARYVEVHGHPILDASGEVAQMIEYNLDVTDRRLAERALRESEERWRSIVESEPECVKVLDTQGRVVEMNPAGLEMIQACIEDVRDKPAIELVAEEDRPAFLEMLAGVFRGERRHLAFDIVGLASRRLTLDTISVPLWDPDDPKSVKFLLGVARDITERKRAEEQASRLAAIVRSSTDGIVGITLGGVVTSWNRGAEATYGYAENEMVGKNVSILVPPGRRDELARINKKLSAGEPLDRYETKRRRKDGRDIDVSLTLSPILGDDGRVVGAAAIAREITARKRQEGINASRLHLLQFAIEHSVDELLEETLNETERLTESLIALHYFVDDDQRSLRLQTRSTRTKELFRQAEGTGPHGAIPKAGAWADCVRERRAVVHNDCASPTRKTSAPQGPTSMVRELAVPVFRGNRIAAILGVGNKQSDYTKEDIEVVSSMADLAWDIVERKRAEEALRESEEHLRRVYENSPLAYQSLDAEGRLVDVNPVWCTMLGYAREEVLGKLITELLTPESVELLKERFPLFKRTGEIHGAEFVLVRHDGMPIEIEVDGRIGRDRDGNFRQTYCILHDITERKRLEKEMRRAAAAMEQAAEAIVIADTDAVIQYVNPAFTKVTGYSREEALGRNPRFLQSGRHDAAFYSQLWDTLRRGEIWNGHFINRRKDGSVYEEDASISPVRDEAGKVAFYVAVKRDVSREVELQEQLNRAQKMEALGSLASGIAHDFNNVLMVIQGSTELMLRGLPPGDPLQQHLGTVLRSARHAASLTRGLLSFSRRQILQPEIRALDQLVQGALPMLRRLIPESCEVRFEAGPEVGAVRVDLTHFEQVLLNLCVNARDAMPSGGSITIRVANLDTDESYVSTRPWASVGRFVALSVADTGSGIDSDALPHIFEPFFTTKAPGRGTGLGLATVYGIVKQHGGTIDVVSKPGKGAVFTVLLPRIETPESVPAQGGEEMMLQGGSERILIVEDEPELRGLLVRTLTELGYRVGAAPDGSTALSMIVRGKPRFDLVVSDLVMPSMGGTDLLRRIRATRPNLPVLISSGYGDMGDSFELPSDPHLGFIAKPYEIAVLARSVRSLLDRGAEEA